MNLNLKHPETLKSHILHDHSSLFLKCSLLNYLSSLLLPSQPQNYRKKITDGVNLKLANSPTIEAMDIVAKLDSDDDKVLRKTTFLLQKYIKVGQQQSLDC